MNKTELVAAIAEKAQLSKKDSEAALKAFIDVVTDELKNDGKVQLVGFGTFEVAKRAAREGINPLTKEPEREFTDLEEKMALCGANFLGKQMEQ